jgi:hypothetical protein
MSSDVSPFRRYLRDGHGPVDTSHLVRGGEVKQATAHFAELSKRESKLGTHGLLATSNEAHDVKVVFVISRFVIQRITD